MAPTLPLPASATAAEIELAEILATKLGQQHLFASWKPAGSDDDKRKQQMLKQLQGLDKSYPGGLAAYVASAKRLLGQSSRGENPLEGWSPSVPADGFDLTPGTAEYERFERSGIAQAGAIGFVVPAGGLGERLGYSGVKFALPSEVSSGALVLEVYCGYILAAQGIAQKAATAQAKAEAEWRAVAADASSLNTTASEAASTIELPLAIMVSDDTESGIKALLEERAYFGLKPSQVTLLKQEKVAALKDAAAAFSMDNAYTVATKPHGHGDVHFLLHSTGLAKRWHDQGIKFLHFFQDTNTLYFSDFLATIGVSATHNVAVNLVATPRKAKEAIGAVCKLTHTDGRTMIANVEYNQLEPLLLASGFAEGDVNEAESGFSRFPGNINQIIINLDSWLECVSATNGAIDEFINPKYLDKTRTAFKPTRLECMMQDYVKTVPSTQKVAWTRYPQWLGYFPCKNHIVAAAKLSADGVPPHSASSSEMAVYHFHAQALRTLGASVGEAAPRTFRGVGVDVGAAIVLAPSFAPCFTLLKEKLPNPSQISITSKSTLVVRGEKVIIEQLELDGALTIEVEDGGKLTIKSLKVANEGWEFAELDDAKQEAADEKTQIRGFELLQHEHRFIKVSKGEDIVIEKSRAKKASLNLGVRLDASMRRKKKKSKTKDPDNGLPTLIKIEPQRGGCVPAACAIL